MRHALRVVIAFLLGIGGGAPGADAQVSSTLPLIVVLEPGPSSSPTRGVDRFKRGLGELGWVEGRSVRFETRYADYSVDRMATLAKEVVTLKPDLVFTHGPLTQTVTQAIATIPIVVGVGGDLVGAGIAKSLARPGGNTTGMSVLAPELDLKRLETLKAAIPAIRRVGVLMNTATTGYDERLSEGARALGMQLHIERLSTPNEIRRALSALKKSGVDALLVQDEPMLSRAAKDVAALALAMKLPSISQSPGFAEAGGLLQFGVDVLEAFGRSAGHADKILRGAKPGDLPIEQPTLFELVVNLRTADMLGLALPPSVLVRANKVLK